MNKLLFAAAVFAASLLVSVARAELTPERKTAAEALIKQFNADDYDVREKAVKDMVAMGPDVVPLLKEAMAKADVEEVRMRCTMALNGIASAALKANSAEIAKNFAWSCPLASRSNQAVGMHNDCFIVGVAGTPVRCGSVVLAVGLDGEIHAMNAAAGKEVWVTSTSLPPVGDLGERGQVQSAPAACAGVAVYRSGEKLFGVDAETGKPLWESALDGLPAASGDMVYVTPAAGGLLALDPKTGKEVWRAKGDDDVRNVLARPVAAEGIVAVAETDASIPRPFAPAGPPRMGGKPAPPEPVYGGNRVRAFDAKSGRELWRATTAPCVDLHVSGGRVIVQSAGKLAALNAQDGKEIWSVDFPAGERVTIDSRAGTQILSHAPDLCVTPDVVVGIRGEEAIVLDAKTGRETRRFTPDASTVPAPNAALPPFPRMMYSGVTAFTGEGGPVAVAPYISSRSAPVVDGTTIILAGSNGIHAYDLATGARLWFLATKSFPSGRPLLADSVLYFGTTLPSKVKPPLPPKPENQIDDVGLNAVRLK